MSPSGHGRSCVIGQGGNSHGVLSFVNLCGNVSPDRQGLHRSAFARFLEDTRSVFAMLAPASLGSVAWPSPDQLFGLTPYASVSHEDWLIFLNSDDTRRCDIDWGPSPQSVRNLLLSRLRVCIRGWAMPSLRPSSICCSAHCLPNIVCFLLDTVSRGRVISRQTSSCGTCYLAPYTW